MILELAHLNILIDLSRARAKDAHKIKANTIIILFIFILSIICLSLPTNINVNMTEKEKMLAGELYDCSDPELIDRWHRAKELQKQYERTSTRNSAELNAILDKLIGSRGEGVSIAAPIYVDYGENIHLGNNIEINMNCTMLDCNRITIGDNSGIGPSVQIYTVGHPIKATDRLSKNGTFWNSVTAPVTIGRNVWIGGGSIILPGVTIGDNTTIGAGSVVSTSIAANCLAVGNPCRVIREL